MAWKRRLSVSTEDTSAAGFIGACSAAGRVGADQALRGRSLLYFSDQRVFAVGQLCADRPDKTARRGAAFASASRWQAGAPRLAAAISSRL